jgi:hypothetical protein
MLGKNTGPKSEEQKHNQSESMKGKIPWNKDKSFSEEAKQNMRKPHKKFSEETKKQLSSQRKKRIKSEKHKQNIAKSKMGINNPMYGKIPWNKGLKKNNNI